MRNKFNRVYRLEVLVDHYKSEFNKRLGRCEVSREWELPTYENEIALVESTLKRLSRLSSELTEERVKQLR